MIYSSRILKGLRGQHREGFLFARTEEVAFVPYKAQKPCAAPGCRELTSSRFCPAHAKQDAREYERYRRDPETRKRYGQVWRVIRAGYIAAHPLCERCLQAGRVTPAEHVHHKIELRMGGTHDESNLMALCSSCHSGITLSENNRRKG
jgi:5-methylcytosine-specific restriction protein A